MIDFSPPTDQYQDRCRRGCRYEGQKLSWAAQDIDKASKGALAAAVKAASFAGRAGAVPLLFNLTGVSAARVVVYGAGSGNALSAKDARATGRAPASCS